MAAIDKFTPDEWVYFASAPPVFSASEFIVLPEFLGGERWRVAKYEGGFYFLRSLDGTRAECVGRSIVERYNRKAAKT